ncbi:MAG: CDP-alcohol phosphatidyltransferase family protein [Gemmatimonadales bacterium]|nr:MAG: CDP-alcohol phosphatidyltransferase family protein [Gemmatimonadales bacterium]
MTAATAGVLLLAGLIASMPLFALRFRGRSIDPDVARRPASVLLDRWVRNWMVWALGPLERTIVRTGLSPDALNYFGLAAGMAAGVSFAMGALGPAAWLLALNGISDILDGRVARARGIASRYGAFLDSTLDRFAETGTFVGIAGLLAGSPWMTAATVLAISGSLLVSYTRARGEALGAGFSGGLMQRAERVVLLVLGALLDPAGTSRMGWPPGTVLAGTVVVIALGTVGTALYRTAVTAGMLARAEAPNRMNDG